MGIDSSGAVTWKVPRDFAEERVTVIISLSTDDGQSVYETFQLECPQAIALNREKAAVPPRGDKRAETPRPSGFERRRSSPSREPNSPDGAEVAISGDPADHGLEVHLNPEGMFRSLVPNPEFSGGGAPVYRQPVPRHDPVFPARARLRVYNRSRKTITALTMTVSNDYPPLMQHDVPVDLLSDLEQLKPGEGVEVLVRWALLPNVAITGGAAKFDIAVTSIRSR
jgi:hypothetical protein